MFMPEEDRENLRLRLNNGILTVGFKKADGTLRPMRCTTNGEAIFGSGNVLTVTGKTRKVRTSKDPNVQAVWDLDKQAWRSFNYDSVIYVQETV